MRFTSVLILGIIFATLDFLHRHIGVVLLHRSYAKTRQSPSDIPVSSYMASTSRTCALLSHKTTRGLVRESKQSRSGLISYLFHSQVCCWGPLDCLSGDPRQGRRRQIEEQGYSSSRWIGNLDTQPVRTLLVLCCGR
jgi:hypothetical protein